MKVGLTLTTLVCLVEKKVKKKLVILFSFVLIDILIYMFYCFQINFFHF